MRRTRPDMMRPTVAAREEDEEMQRKRLYSLADDVPPSSTHHLACGEIERDYLEKGIGKVGPKADRRGRAASEVRSAGCVFYFRKITSRPGRNLLGQMPKHSPSSCVSRSGATSPTSRSHSGTSSLPRLTARPHPRPRLRVRAFEVIGITGSTSISRSASTREAAADSHSRPGPRPRPICTRCRCRHRGPSTWRRRTHQASPMGGVRG
ncbi:hypothetical protein GQ55_9G155300 [Panicum hallii var. hallii]|uniref:Uncharacterized protein n=1 Tax=Panicum hallii var. hallii TaxID=1504633 RepID=A0A2T7C3J2_9POAL|nr:hypothetical protein GQ55_9G155300 [Panicum hallii var. hallii]